MTPATIGAIRTSTNWIMAKAVEAYDKAGTLGRPTTDEKLTLQEIYTALDDIAAAAKKAKKRVHAEQKK